MPATFNVHDDDDFLSDKIDDYFFIQTWQIKDIDQNVSFKKYKGLANMHYAINIIEYNSLLHLNKSKSRITT